jgi:antitoxin component YwqK of YwqJK toxin-antitoxin module
MKKVFNLFLSIAFPALLFAQTPKVEKVYYENTNVLMYEYQYITGKTANVTNVISRDSKTKELTGIDTRNHGMSEMLKHGYYKEYAQNGKLKCELTYKEGKKHGKGKSYYESGTVQSEFNFSSNVLDGDFVAYYQNGEKEDECKYEKGKRTGKGFVYFEGGGMLELDYLLSDELNYKTEQSFASAKGYHENNNPMLEGTMKILYPKSSAYTYENFKYYFDGEWKRYDENGKLTSIENYSDDFLEGKTINYYPNGNKQEELTYRTFKTKNGLKSEVEGKYLYYYENGRIKTQGYLVYWPTDSTSTTEKTYVWKWYDENGEPTVYAYYLVGVIKKQVDQSAITTEEKLNFDLPFLELKKNALGKYGSNYVLYFSNEMALYYMCVLDEFECKIRKQFFKQVESLLTLLYNKIEASETKESLVKWVGLSDKVYSKLPVCWEDYSSEEFKAAASDIQYSNDINRKLKALNIISE